MTADDEIARLTITVPAGAGAALERAAALQGRSIPDFVVSAAHEAAQRAIEAEEIIRLSAEDQRRFAGALLNPPKPNSALRRAKAAHRAIVETR